MKIVHVEDFFHPDAGYQVNILSKYMVNHGISVTIITAEMDLIPESLTSFFGKEKINEHDRQFENEYHVKIIRIPAIKYLSGRVIFDCKVLERTIHQENPDVLYVHGNDTYTGMWIIYHMKRLGYPIITDSHMVALASNNRFRKLFYLFYRMIITPKIKKNAITVIRTADDEYIYKYLGIPLEQAPVISFGSDTLLFHPDNEEKYRFRSSHNISMDACIVLYAGKLDEAKGGLFLASLTTEVLNIKRELVYLIIGNSVGEYGKTVEKRFSESKYRIMRFPTQKYKDLAKLYQVADIAVIPRQCSLSIFDLQASGLPILAEDNSINVERLAYDNGWVFQTGDLVDFKFKLEGIINDSQKLSLSSGNALNLINEKFNYEDKSREYEQEIDRTFQLWKSSQHQ